MTFSDMGTSWHLHNYEQVGCVCQTKAMQKGAQLAVVVQSLVGRR